MHDELIHVSRLLAKARLTVSSLLRGSELMLEERVVLRADYYKVVRHLQPLNEKSGRI